MTKLQSLLKSTDKKVFISGSGNIKTFKPEVIQSLNKIMEQGMVILIGDCHGVDTMVQQYCETKGYHKVVVFHMPKLRNLMSNEFATCCIKPEPNVKHTPRDYYALKDIAMSHACDYALAIWNGVSNGTKANIDRLKQLGKPTKVLR